MQAVCFLPCRGGRRFRYHPVPFAGEIPMSKPLLALCLPLMACAVDGSGAPRVVESSIQGGYFDDSDESVVALVAVSGGVSICSGTLISQNVVLTARHCVASVLAEHPDGGVICGTTYFGSQHQPSAYHYTTAAQLSWNVSLYRPIAESMVPPSSDTFCGYDIALVRLADPVDPTITPPRVPRVDEALSVPNPFIAGSGEGYSAVGFGQASEGTNTSGVRRRRDGLFATCGEGNCGGFASQMMTETEWLGDTGVCQGDSGGPALDLQGRVIGVASRGGGGCSSPIYASVYAWRDWIKDEVVRAADDGGVFAPAWATGWPTHPDFNHPIGAECDADEECPSGVCILGRYCTRKCSELAPCGSDFFCNIADYCILQEVGAGCSADADCDSGACHQGHCTRGCNGGAWACPEGWLCAAGSDMCELQPVGLACVTDDKCDGGTCVDGLCTRSCSDIASCPQGWACDAGQCALLPVGDECEADDDCGAGGRCDLEHGRCTRECWDWAPCPEPWRCGDSGECSLAETGAECSTDADCDAGASCGDDSVCTRGCDALAPCSEGTTCSDDGLCEAVVVPPREPPGGCGSGAPPTAPLGAVLLGILGFGLGLRRRSGRVG